ncbi:putative Phytocyanin domain-containing protein [Helianthus annuus]|nr:putative Phytocyanin domain-containing protein [Helianthus annuus]
MCYGNCSDQGFIFNITRGAGREIFELTQPKRYYFLSSGGYYYNGMKVSVNVVEFVPPTQPSPPKSGSDMISTINPLILSMVISVWVVLVLK